jgi:predicted lactoylglutathione lyase
MTKQFWLNLPVRDIKKSIAFFKGLGFKFNEQQTNDHMACMLLGEKEVVVMLCSEPTFKGYTNNEIADPKHGTEVLLSIDAQSKEEVDEIMKKALEAGGNTNHKPKEMQGWMYGSNFTDIDGHKWNVLFMDMAKMPK